MKRYTQLPIYFFYIFLLLMWVQCTERGDSASQIQDKISAKISDSKQVNMGANAKSFDYLLDSGGKYPYEIRLLETEPLNSRIKKLLGSRADTFFEWWDVEEPIREIQPRVMWAEACKAHECGFVDFALYINIAEDYIIVGINTEEETKVFTENTAKDLPKQMLDWRDNRR